MHLSNEIVQHVLSAILKKCQLFSETCRFSDGPLALILRGLMVSFKMLEIENVESGAPVIYVQLVSVFADPFLYGKGTDPSLGELCSLSFRLEPLQRVGINQH